MLTQRRSHRLSRHLAKWTWLVLALIAISSISTASEQDLIDAAKGTPQKLNIYNWADYIHPDAITRFEEEFGIDITYDIYDSSESSIPS